MKPYLLLLFMASTSLHAKCYLHQLSGHLDIIKQEIKFTVNEGTLSQKVLTIADSELLELSPFIDRDITATIILSTKEVYNKSKILNMSGSELTVLDPLNPVPPLAQKEVKEVQCP